MYIYVYKGLRLFSNAFSCHLQLQSFRTEDTLAGFPCDQYFCDVTTKITIIIIIIMVKWRFEMREVQLVCWQMFCFCSFIISQKLVYNKRNEIVSGSANQCVLCVVHVWYFMIINHYISILLPMRCKMLWYPAVG